MYAGFAYICALAPVCRFNVGVTFPQMAKMLTLAAYDDFSRPGNLCIYSMR
jgi:hypothetical protein